MSPPPAATVRVRAQVFGRVQGVFFRASARREALRLGLRGHAANLADGSVEVVAEGDETAVEALLAWLRVGPPRAEVSRVEVERGVVTGEPSSFAIR